MYPAPNAVRAGQLHRRLSEIWGIPFEVPAHLAVRLDALIGDLDVVYLEAAVQPTDLGQAGAILALTDQLAFFAELDERRSQVSDSYSSVVLSAWPRSTLGRIEVAGADDRNSDRVWEVPPQLGWPGGAHIALWYANRETPLHLPLSTTDVSQARREAVAMLLPSLLRDLARHE